MNLSIKIIFCSVLVTMLWICTALAGDSVMREIERINRISIYLPATTELSKRGSIDNQREFMVETPVTEIQTADIQMLSDFLGSVSERNAKVCEREFVSVDAVARVYFNDGSVEEFVVEGERMKATDTGVCYSIPKWIGRAIAI